MQGGTFTVVGFRTAVGVVGPLGVTTAVRGSGPENKLNVLMVMFDVMDLPGRTVTVVGLELRA